MTRLAPLTKEMMTKGVSKGWYNEKDVWLAAQFFKLNLRPDMTMDEICALSDEAFGACRPETDVEKALSEAKERIKRQEVKL